MLKMKAFVFIGLFLLCHSQNIFMPNLPLGEYRMVLNKVYHCGSTKNHSLLFHLYFSKRTSSITELKGNMTLLIPFDDTLTLDMNIMSWGLTGGWIPNYSKIITKKACSNIKKLFGSVWFTFTKGFNIPTNTCPLPAATYTTSGIDLNKLEDHNFPKVFFYGKYKVLIRFKNAENMELGCEAVEINLIRPWETPI